MASHCRALARNQLGNSIFHNNWLTALLAGFLTGGLLVAAQILANVLGPVVGIVLAGPLEYGLSAIFLKQARDHAGMQMGDLFNGFRVDFGGTLLIGLLTKLFSILWGLLFFIPGIIKAYSYSMAYYIKADNPTYTAMQCINESRALMHGHKWQLFCLDLSFIGWAIVGALCFGVGTLWVVAYQNAAHAQFYELISGHNQMP